MKALRYLFLLFPLIILSSCSEKVFSLISIPIQMEAIHFPIYPGPSDSVLYKLSYCSTDPVEKIQLFRSFSPLPNQGPGHKNLSTNPMLLREWELFPNSRTGIVEHIDSTSLPIEILVTYWFVVETNSGITRTDSITFATNPIGLNDRAIPVYCQGAIDDVFNVVFIPDQDINIGLMGEFYNSVHHIIENTIHRESALKAYNRQFNVFIYPEQGIADRDPSNGIQHLLPSNSMSILCFAQAIGILHQDVFDDSYRISRGCRVFSSEWDRPQTVLHELGHLFFGLSDEYESGLHRQDLNFPNNWNSLNGANLAAPAYLKTSSDVRNIINQWHKLCVESCPMNSGSELYFQHDSPCFYKIRNEILTNASN